MKKTKTKMVPGWRVCSNAAIYGGAHHSEGMKAWEIYLRELSRDTLRENHMRVWLEYGPNYSYEDTEMSSKR